LYSNAKSETVLYWCCAPLWQHHRIVSYRRGVGGKLLRSVVARNEELFWGATVLVELAASYSKDIALILYTDK